MKSRNIWLRQFNRRNFSTRRRWLPVLIASSKPGPGLLLATLLCFLVIGCRGAKKELPEPSEASPRRVELPLIVLERSGSQVESRFEKQRTESFHGGETIDFVGKIKIGDSLRDDAPVAIGVIREAQRSTIFDSEALEVSNSDRVRVYQYSFSIDVPDNPGSYVTEVRFGNLGAKSSIRVDVD